jgi:hypothetical protein
MLDEALPFNFMMEASRTIKDAGYHVSLIILKMSHF